VNSFPDECRYVLETLAAVFHNDALTRERGLTADDRLQFHQQHSLSRMEELHAWCRQQFDERKVEPNSGLGKAIQYLLRHWPELTLFLRQVGAPLDNNIVTAARGSAKIMPTARLCRVGVSEQCLARRISGFRGVVCRHNHRLSRKASKGSGGRNRSGVSPDGVACASARSFSCMSACR
jgi:hypothetical protein